MRRAQQALTRGDPNGALSLLADHRARFPVGQLTDTREGVWVRALCKAGRPAEARARAAKLAELRPDSPVSEAVQDVCRE